MGDNKEKPEYLEISCQNIEFSAELGEIVEDSFAIHAADKYTEGKIYSSDTRMRVHENTFSVRRHRFRTALTGHLLRRAAVSVESLY